jgi:nucleoside 2-deoxyribosyltransferase
MKKIFIIHVVRIATPNDIRIVEQYVSMLEADGHKVHLPIRDTNQQGTSLQINYQNMNAIKEADEVHIFYNNKSQGIHFDMGVAFCLNKKIVVREYMIDGKVSQPSEFVTQGKSYHKFLSEYENITSVF